MWVTGSRTGVPQQPQQGCNRSTLTCGRTPVARINSRSVPFGGRGLPPVSVPELQKSLKQLTMIAARCVPSVPMNDMAAVRERARNGYLARLTPRAMSETFRGVKVARAARGKMERTSRRCRIVARLQRTPQVRRSSCRPGCIEGLAEAGFSSVRWLRPSCSGRARGQCGTWRPRQPRQLRQRRRLLSRCSAPQ
jgi:hypothetical protein